MRGTQGRWRALLRANRAVAGDLTLSTVLSRISEAARELLGARYAALGVLAPEGGLAELCTGLPEDVERHLEEQVGHLPHGEGLDGYAALFSPDVEARSGTRTTTGREAGARTFSVVRAASPTW